MKFSDFKLMNKECNNCSIRMCKSNTDCIYRAKKLNYDLPLDKKFENYVYFNLRDYGNCYIGEREYNILGEDKIKADIIKNGFKNPTVRHLDNLLGAIITVEKRHIE